VRELAVIEAASLESRFRAALARPVHERHNALDAPHHVRKFVADEQNFFDWIDLLQLRDGRQQKG